MAKGNGGVRIYDPTIPAPRPTGGLATRGPLEGKRLGLLGNSKRNADKVLEAIGKMLTERAGVQVVGTWHKPNTLPVVASIPTFASEMTVFCSVRNAKLAPIRRSALAPWRT